MIQLFLLDVHPLAYTVKMGMEILRESHWYQHLLLHLHYTDTLNIIGSVNNDAITVWLCEVSLFLADPKIR